MAPYLCILWGLHLCIEGVEIYKEAGVAPVGSIRGCTLQIYRP